MQSFKRKLHLQSQPPELVRIIRQIAQYNGKEELYFNQIPQVLDVLRQAAVIHSTESSNRLEGIVVSNDRIKDLVNDKAQPRNRSEQEVAGYRSVLDMIHQHYDDIPFTNGVIRQFHRDLYKYKSEPGGVWKQSDNSITAKLPDGTEVIRFQPVSAFDTPMAMDELMREFDNAIKEGLVDPLILIPIYILDFLSIHPFGDGNGRIARLISLLLLYKAGYNVGRYISLEKIVEDTKESYYDTLYTSSQGWHQGEHDIMPWVEYFLGVVLLTAYREFENRVQMVGKADKKMLVENLIDSLPMKFHIGDIREQLPSVSLPTIHRALKNLKDQGKVTCVKPGRNALWIKTGM